MADGHYAPYSIAPAGSLLRRAAAYAHGSTSIAAACPWSDDGLRPAGCRQPPPTAREFSYAKQMTWDDACAGSKELRAAQARGRHEAGQPPTRMCAQSRGA